MEERTVKTINIFLLGLCFCLVFTGFNTVGQTQVPPILQLSTNLREVSQCLEKAPTRAFFLLKGLVESFSVITKIRVDLCFKL